MTTVSPLTETTVLVQGQSTLTTPTTPTTPMADVWTAKDEEELVKLSNKEIDMSETYLGRYAAIKVNTPTIRV